MCYGNMASSLLSSRSEWSLCSLHSYVINQVDNYIIDVRYGVMVIGSISMTLGVIAPE